MSDTVGIWERRWIRRVRALLAEGRAPRMTVHCCPAATAIGTGFCPEHADGLPPPGPALAIHLTAMHGLTDAVARMGLHPRSGQWAEIRPEEG